MMNMFKSNQQSILKTLDQYPSSYLFRQCIKSDDFKEVRDVLDTGKGLTLFCPVNDAVKAFECQSKMFGADMTELMLDVLKCHVADTTVEMKDAPCVVENLMTDDDWVNKGEGKGQILKICSDECGYSVMFGIPGWPMWTARIWSDCIKASNGNIYFISKVMRFPYSPSTMMRMAGKGISFRYAIESASLSSIANSTCCVTILVPRSGAVDKLLGKGVSPDVLSDVLKAHHVKGSFTSLDLKDGQKLNTLNGHQLTVSVQEDTIKINGVKVCHPDIITKNGVIHIIEDVIEPKLN